MKKSCLLRKNIAVFFAVIFLAMCLFPLTALASEEDDSGEEFIEKKQNYDIAMVFDNSLSMFYDKVGGGENYEYVPRWSRAKFSMEVFASMLDLGGGDTLTIFPMWKVKCDGSRDGVPAENQSPDKLNGYLAGPKDKVEIKSQKDIDNISRMHTVYSAGTPFDAVANALNYLKGLKNKDGSRTKWLIILTDGAFGLYRNAEIKEDSHFNINEEINKLGADDVFIQYLSIDMPDDNPQKPAGNDRFFVDNAKGAGIQDKLIEVCNRIFERNELPRSAISASTLKLDLSMRKVIVFAQGQGVEIKGLKDAAGDRKAILSDSGTRKFSDYSFGYSGYKTIGNESVVADTSLYGQVVTFADCPAGDYTLEIDGAGSSDLIQVFYEPDVRIQTHLFNNENNEEIKEGDDVHPGEYTVKSSIVDRKTQEDVSASPLLGDDQVYTITVTNGEKTFNINNGDTITLQVGEAEIAVQVSYLGGKYTLKNTDSPLFKGFHIEFPTLNTLAVKLSCQQELNWYEMKKHDTWKPVRADVTLDGEKLSDEQMAALDISHTYPDESVVLSHKLLPGESAFEIYVCQDENGDYREPADKSAGSLKVECRLKDKFDRDIIGSDSTLINIQPYSKFLPLLIGISIFCGLSALILWFMSRKVLPRKLVKKSMIFTISGREIQGQNTVNYNRKAKKLSVRSAMPPNPDQECKISFSLYPVGRRWTPSRRRKFGINGISGPSMGVKTVTLNGITYTRDSRNRFIAPGASPDDPIKDETIGAMIVINAKRSTLNCTLENK